jgi:hypothetical protein
MKRTAILLIFFSFVSFAQNETTEETVSSAIENLFSVSKSKDYKEACSLIAFTGNDASKYYLVPLNPKVTYDLEKAERIAKKIKAYLDISDSYEIKSVSSHEENEHKFIDVVVGFKSGKQTLDIDFKFVEVNNNLLLVSVD